MLVGARCPLLYSRMSEAAISGRCPAPGGSGQWTWTSWPSPAASPSGAASGDDEGWRAPASPPGIPSPSPSRCPPSSPGAARCVSHHSLQDPSSGRLGSGPSHPDPESTTSAAGAAGTASSGAPLSRGGAHSRGEVWGVWDVLRVPGVWLWSQGSQTPNTGVSGFLFDCPSPGPLERTVPPHCTLRGWPCPNLSCSFSHPVRLPCWGTASRTAILPGIIGASRYKQEQRHGLLFATFPYCRCRVSF